MAARPSAASLRSFRTITAILLAVVLTSPLQLIATAPIEDGIEGPRPAMTTLGRQLGSGDDLSVEGIALTPPAPVDGLPLQVVVTLRSTLVPLPDEVRLQLSVDGLPQAAASVQVLAVTTSAVLEWPAEAGIHQLRVEATALGLGEADRANNAADTVVSVPRAQLRLEPLAIEPTTDPLPGEQVSVDLRLHNDGATTVRPFVVRLSAGEQTIGAQTVAGLSAGSTWHLRATARMGNGPLVLRGIADTADTIAEGTEVDNSVVAILGQQLPDLGIGPLRLLHANGTAVGPEGIRSGEQPQVVANITNGAASTLARVPVRLTVDGSPIRSASVVGLAAGENTTLIFPWGATGGSHLLRVEVDPEGLLLEDDRAPDGTQLLVVIPQPQLSVENLLISPLVPIDGGTIEVRAQVRNSGGDHLGDVAVVATVDGGETASVLLPVPPADGTTTVTLHLPHRSGVHLYRLSVNEDRRVLESRWGDNAASTNATTSRPDLRLTNVTMPSTGIDGANGLVHIEVRNVGAPTVRSFDVVLLQDGAPIASSTIAGLGANRTTTLDLPWVVTLGAALVSVEVDPSGVVPDATLGDRTQLRTPVGLAPQLRVDDLQFSPADAGLGDPVTVTLLARNLGGSTLRPLLVEIRADGVLVGSRSLPGLVGGGVRALSFSTTLEGGVLSAILDAADAVAEANELDNTMAIALPSGIAVPPLQAVDLTVSALRLDPAQPHVGDPLDVIVSVRATGDADALGPPSVALLTDGRLSAVGSLTFEADVSTMTFHTTAMGGEHQYLVWLDHQGHLLELDEGDNRATANLSLQRPDLALASIEAVPPLAVAGEQTTLFATVTDRGAGALGGGAEVRFYADGELLGRRTLNGVSLDGAVTVALSARLSPGFHAIAAVVDPLEQWGASDLSDQLAVGTAGVTVPDLFVVRPSLPVQQAAGLPLPLQLTIQNRGGAVADPPPALLLRDGQVLSQVRLLPMTGLSNQSLTLSVPLAPGLHELGLLLDPADALTEANEADRGVTPLGIVDIPAPQLRIETFEPVVLPTDAAPADGSLLVRVTVHNDGAPLLGEALVQVRADGDVVQQWAIGGLPSDGHAAAVVRVTLGPGSHVVQCLVDPTDLLREASEADNVRTLLLEGPDPPQLEGLELAVLGSGIDGAPVIVQMLVTNLGGPSILPGSVLFTQDGALLAQARLPPLGSGNSTWVGVEAVALAGRHILRATIDPADAIAEAAEDDQLLNLSVVAQPAQLLPGALEAYDLHDGRLLVLGHLTNIGGPTLRTVSAALQLDGAQVGRASAPGLEGGGTLIVSAVVPHVASLEGTVDLALLADPDDLVPEALEGGHRSAQVVILGELPRTDGPTAAAPNIEVSGVTLSPPQPIDGERVLLSVHLRADQPLLGPILLNLSLDGEPVATTVIGALPAGGSDVGTILQAVGGRHQIVAEVTGLNVTERLTLDNRQAVGLNVSAPEWRLSGLAPPPLPDGLLAALPLRLHNDGGATLRAPRLVALADGNGIATGPCPALGAGASADLQVLRTAVAGATEVAVIVNAEHLGGELETGDNRLQVQWDVPRPSVVISNVSLGLDPAGQARWFFVTVRNSGATSARPWQVQLDGAAAATTHRGIVGLEAGGDSVIGLAAPPEPGAGDELHLRLDATGALALPNESMQQAQLQIGRPAVGAPVNVTFETAQGTQAQLLNLTRHQYRTVRSGGNLSLNRYDIAVEVHNRGVQDLDGLVVRILVDGAVAEDRQVPLLRAGATTSVLVPFEGEPSAHLLTAILDPSGATPEENETDNRLRLEVPANQPPRALAGGARQLLIGERMIVEGQGIDIDGRIVQYSWDFDGDGVDDFVSNVTGATSYTYHRSGTYLVRLRVVDDGNASADEKVVVVVSEESPPHVLGPPMTALLILLVIGSGIAVVVGVPAWVRRRRRRRAGR